MKFFVRVDYVYHGSPVQRVRCLQPSFSDVQKFLSTFRGGDFMVLTVKIERCS